MNRKITDADILHNMADRHLGPALRDEVDVLIHDGQKVTACYCILGGLRRQLAEGTVPKCVLKRTCEELARISKTGDADAWAKFEMPEYRVH